MTELITFVTIHAMSSTPQPQSSQKNHLNVVKLRILRPEDIETGHPQPTDRNMQPPSWHGLEPTTELLSELAQESKRLETATPAEILQWTLERFADHFTMATAFGPEGMVLIHMLSEIDAPFSIFNLDTGYQFRETLELRERVTKRYGIEVELKRPELSVAEYEEQNGGPVYVDRPDQCCFDRKIKLLRPALHGKHAWASAIRRDQSPDRALAPIVGWDDKFQLVKVSPLANWTKGQVWKMITDYDIPYNPLHDQGYPSIGCQPCTRAVLLGEDERAGRWSGFAKTECGLHSRD
jgi:phosphoadenosine phosphosulfate reductase